MANADIRQGYKNTAWFTANPTLVLKQGQRVNLEQTGTYKLGDGTTQLSVLSFLGGGGSQTLAQTLVFGKSTGANDIEITGTQKITTDNNTNKIALNGTIAGEIDVYSENDINIIADLDLNITAGNTNISDNLKMLNETASTLTYFDAFKRLRSLDVATNPNLTEITYVKDVTSPIQTQLNDKANLSDLVSIFVTARNNTGSTITKGSLVYVSGAIGQNPTIALAKADAEATSFDIGMASFDIPNNTNVQNNVTIGGLITGLNTSAFADGDPLFLSYTTAGGFTNVAPVSPNFSQSIGVCLHSHITLGKILIRTEVPLAVNTTLSSSNKIAPTSGAVKYNIDLKEPIITATTNVDFWSGAKTFINFANTVRATLLTGFVSGAGTVASTDTILQAFNKIVGNIALKLTANVAIVGATKTKITYDANGLVTSGTDATTADINDSTNRRYVTDAQLVVVGNTSGTNTGDNAVNTLYSGLVSNATHTGDATGATALTVVALNGTNLAGLTTGVLKNTTTTGVPFISKVVLTEPATLATLTIANNKTLTVNNSITFSGTDATVMTLPTTTATIARTDAAQTFTGVQTFSTPIATGSVATMTSTVGGGVPTPPNNTTTFLRGDGTFATPAGGSTSYITTNRQTASYSLVLTDDAKMIEMNVGTANNLTVPLNATQAFTIGTQILVNQYGAGQTTIVATGGVTLNYTDTLTTRASKSIVCLIKIGTNEWDVTGDTTPLVALMTQTDLDNAMNIDYLYDYVQARGAAFL